MQFNEAQQRAVSHVDGPMLVLAGPGSGKTAVITGRTRHLCELGIAPSSVLVVTFTRSAAAEMRGRFQKLAGSAGKGVTFGTFHGIFYGILRNSFRLQPNAILSGAEKNALLREIIGHLCKDADEEQDLPGQVASEISRVKSDQIDLGHYYSGVLPQDTFRSVYRAYEEWKKDNGRMDFDDIIVRCYELLTTRKDICRLWQQKFQYIQVDEFQDISPLQYKIVRILAEPQRNLFIVGDDDQSIYRFRGANPGIMLGFPRDYPDAETVLLDVNYRSTPQILAASSRLIAHNRNRFRKKLRAAQGAGPDVAFRIFDNPKQECAVIARKIREEHEKGTPYEEIAVLSRTNPGTRNAVEQLMAYQIPFQLGEAMPCLYDHWIAKDILAYMEIGSGSMNRRNFLRIYNKPNRYFKREAFLSQPFSFDDLYEYYEDREWMGDRVEQFETDLGMIGRLPPYGAVTYIRREIGYEEYVREYARERGTSEEELVGILDDLAESAANYSSLDEWKKAIEAYREKLSQSRRQRQERSGVMVSTLHASKGMEYDSVYILDIVEGMIPYHRAVLDADLEEERRMLYVGMTRAKKLLHLCSVRERYGRSVEVSRFWREIFVERISNEVKKV